GVSVGVTLPAARRAPLVLAQVNPAMPRTLGNAFLHRSQIDAWVEVDEPLTPYPPPVVGEVERAIGRRVAALVPDGATVQVGDGGEPRAAPGRGHRGPVRLRPGRLTLAGRRGGHRAALHRGRGPSVAHRGASRAGRRGDEPALPGGLGRDGAWRRRAQGEGGAGTRRGVDRGGASPVSGGAGARAYDFLAASIFSKISGSVGKRYVVWLE